MEIWKEVIGYEDQYEVSNLGRIRRKDGFIKTAIKNNEFIKIKGKVLKQNLKRNGYLCVDLSKEGKAKTMTVHRIVAIAFLEPQEGRPQVNHKNGNKLDNRVENLEWVTSQENRIHAFKTGLQHGNGKKIRCNQLNMIFESTYKAAEYINLIYFKNSKQIPTVANKIRACALGIQKKAYNFTWNYV